MEINKIYNENCLDTMAKMPNNFIDLTVTSPPYDNLRTYKGYSFDFENVAKELWRVTKQGGVVVWVVGDATINGSESGTSFKQALYFKEIGFNLHDTMIWNKPNYTPRDTRIPRYWQSFEYMFILSKGTPKVCNFIKIECKRAGLKTNPYHRDVNDKLRVDRIGKQGFVRESKPLGNVWNYNSAQYRGHPAPFPEQLANDHIISWSNEGDLIYDPFMGSGTTAKMAILNSRKYIGSEISEDYCKIIETRIKECGGLFF